MSYRHIWLNLLLDLLKLCGEKNSDSVCGDYECQNQDYELHPYLDYINLSGIKPSNYGSNKA